MASLATHFSTFLFIFPIGLRRLHSSFSLYLKDPSHYRSKPWFFLHPKWKNFDLYTLLITLPIAAFSDAFLFLSFSGYPTYRFAFLQRGFVFFLFWALLITVALKESYDLWSINDSLLFLITGVFFFLEYFIIGNSGFTGVTLIGYNLYGQLTLICAFCCLFLSIKQSCFCADLFLSCGLVFKATWVLQIGLNFYTSVFGLKGCKVISVMSSSIQDFVDVKCDLDEDSLRGTALINLLFVWHAIVVVVACFGLFGLLSCKEELRCGEGGGPLLAQIESHSMLMQQLPEIELE